MDENNEPLGLPKFQNIGEKASAGGWWTLFYDPTNANYGADCTFTREGTVFTIKAIWATGDADMGYSPAQYATELFDWNDGCPSAN